MSTPRDVATHELKIWPVFFDAWAKGKKRAEFRKNDRGYKVGDFVLLREYDAKKKKTPYTGRQIKAEILHMVTTAEIPGTDSKGGDYAVISLAVRKIIRVPPSLT